ncbi:hypothetical protein A2U01_0053334, partial [Trifolium medium]|nr:hypothetical protein [Trifolium medium]
APKNIKRKIDRETKKGHKFGWFGVEVWASMMSGDVGMANGQVIATVTPLQQFDATLVWGLEKMGHGS